MKKILASLVLAGLVLASFTPVFAAYMNRINVEMCCLDGVRRDGTVVLTVKTVDCLVGQGSSCLPEDCIIPFGGD